MLGGFSGNIKYRVSVNVTRNGFGSVDDQFDTEVQYLPLAKALPRVKTPFPYFPTREDWPFVREVVGGWTLTPFGGRGRIGQEMVEVEGLVRAHRSCNAVHSKAKFIRSLGSRSRRYTPRVKPSSSPSSCGAQTRLLLRRSRSPARSTSGITSPTSLRSIRSTPRRRRGITAG
jgi:hypothetical protein